MFIDQPKMETRFNAEVADSAEYRPRYNTASGEHLEVMTNENSEEIDQLQVIASRVPGDESWPAAASAACSPRHIVHQ